MPYNHITKDQRVELGALLRTKTSKKDIAILLGKNRVSIWRELKRHKEKIEISKTEYHCQKAQARTKAKRTAANQRFRKIEHNRKLQKYITKKLKRTWTPEQIAGSLKDQTKYPTLCHETIYQYIYRRGPILEKYLRHKRNPFRRKRGTKQREKVREDEKKKRIDQRPEVVEERSRIGDWEGDTVWGKEKTVKILTLVERKSGLLRAKKTETNTAAEVRQKTNEIFKQFRRDQKRTLTFDNGPEFSDHEFIEKDTGLDIYFAYPYHSWERGTNENTNGLLRQFFPKGSSFATITQKQIDHAVWLLNTRPRKRHQYKTPLEVFRGCCTLD